MTDAELNRKVAERAGHELEGMLETEYMVTVPYYVGNRDAIIEEIEKLSDEKQWEITLLLIEGNTIRSLVCVLIASARDLCLAYLEVGE